MDKYQSILLADCVGEVCFRTYRTAHTPFIAAAMQDEWSWQCGGIPGLGTEFPALAVRLLQQYAAANGLSISTIFVDARQAFYAVVRKLVIPLHESDEAVAALFKDLDLPPAALHELAEALSQTDDMTQADAPQPFNRDIASTYTGTHFSVNGSDQVGQALKGTRPGHPYADAVFAFAFQRVLRSVAKRRDDDHPRPIIPTGDPTTLHAQEPTAFIAIPIACFFDDFSLSPTPLQRSSPKQRRP